MLLRRFGAKYERGSLNHPTIGAERRDRITVLTYSHIAKDINANPETIIKFADLMADSRLRKAVKSVLDTVKHHHSAYHSSLPSAFQISTPTQALIAALQRTLHEHLHGLYGTQGARIFPNRFTDQLVQIFSSLEQLQEDNLTTPISSIIHLLESSLQEAYTLHPPSPVTYDSFKNDVDPFFGLSPRKGMVLFALELLGRCAVLDQLPTLWRF
ncbi:uncharacterized protein EI90DRAFT_2399796 [Cantharellus anzutake]|uniref:uncharacterized protein n=1 Tax=Cantharellus anzutake TaxID=1750568 RepID=UPI0019063403|nr:uncharacterized protein EI90DRAFT_2399796 [Cantharellus anzutake]KAF8322833.1 hypothetical protein EI90DRAFT_2399796 [Cantharellus anzutake]